MDDLTPKDPAEAIALYRAQIVGPLVRGELGRGDLVRPARTPSLRGGDDGSMLAT